ncbi:hypothetical protein GCM10020358_81260 [Amorphoplanes nipponensis]|uniref:Uncharacterized protein n=1 Tax=Actinoplanes nipponensis TaxID=135950 RepID=A0A919JC56_9ACTN|nr:hypothetical protein [Actinoplanes nipponensis]GIE47681.1 hypothetical protein Ani05nite_12150 [Actinoplanes nipponensis]
MTAPADQLLQLIFSLFLVVPSSYAVGRVHQWYTHSLRQDLAFRAGYDHASYSMFDLAVRHRTAAAPRAAERPRAVDRPRTADHPRTRTIPRSEPAGRRGRRRDRLPR